MRTGRAGTAKGHINFPGDPQELLNTCLRSALPKGRRDWGMCLPPIIRRSCSGDRTLDIPNTPFTWIEQTQKDLRKGVTGGGSRKAG